jgi:RNA polymerase sigma-70 factor (sigma-E family)
VTVERLATDIMVQRTRDPFGRDGFEEFVNATADRLYRSALLMCGDHHLAEDLTQTTYAKVYSHWSKVAAAESPLAYSRTILTRTFLSHRRLRRSGEQPVETLPDSPQSGPDSAMRMDLLAALRQLPPRDRAVLVLRYWEDLSVERTAEILGIRESACRNRAARALARLRTLLPHLTATDTEESHDQPA